MRHPSIFIADDQSQFCERVVQSLGDRFEVAGLAHDISAVEAAVAGLEPDVVLLDVHMPLLQGLQIAARLRDSAPSAHVLFIGLDEEEVPQVLAGNGAPLGVSIRTCHSDALPAAIWGTLQDDERRPKTSHLTSREREVVQLLAEGKVMKEAAVLLNVSTRTIAFHKYTVMRKLGLRSSAELVRLAISQGIVA